jgi:cell division protein FtsW
MLLKRNVKAFGTIETMKFPRLSFQLPKGRDLIIQFAMVLLNLIGLFMIVSASMTTNTQTNDLVIAFIKQLIFIVFGYVGYLILARHFSFVWARKLIVPLAFISVGMLVAPLFFPAISGARAWIPIPLFAFDLSIQPSEFAKLSIILIFAIYLGDIQVKRTLTRDIVRFPFFIVGLMIFIVLIPQSDTGTAFIMLLLAFFVFLVTGSKRFIWMKLIFIVLFVVSILVVVFVLSPEGIAFIKANVPIPGYMLARFENTINPFVNRFGSGYQLVNSLVAFVRGGWFGVGYGQGLQKYGYLPAARTDFILAVIAEEMGFVGVMVVVTLFVGLIGRIFVHAYQASDDKTRMVLVGVAMYLFSHFALNIGGAIALLPLTGVPLLMLSSGGSSTLSIMFGLGIVQALVVKMRREAE